VIVHPLLAFSLNPFSWIGGAILDGIASGATWAINELSQQIGQVTEVQLTGASFAGSWQAAEAVILIVVVPVFLGSVIWEALHLRLNGIARAVVHLALGGFAVGITLPVAQGFADIVQYLCAAALAAGGGPSTLGDATAKIAGSMALASPGAPGAMVGLVGCVLIFLTFVLWCELVFASAATYLAVAFVGIGFSVSSAKWGRDLTRRLVEVTLALMLVPLIVTMVLIIGANLVTHAPSGSPANDLTGTIEGVVLIGLGTLALPVALRITHVAGDALVVAGSTMRLAGKGASFGLNAAKVGALQGRGGGGGGGSSLPSVSAADRSGGGEWPGYEPFGAVGSARGGASAASAGPPAGPTSGPGRTDAPDGDQHSPPSESGGPDGPAPTSPMPGPTPVPGPGATDEGAVDATAPFPPPPHDPHLPPPEGPAGSGTDDGPTSPVPTAPHSATPPSATPPSPPRPPIEEPPAGPDEPEDRP
jgi:hypothetical protein